MSLELSDVSSERGVLAGICRYGKDAYLDCADLIQPQHFTSSTNQSLASVLYSILQTDLECKIDLHKIFSVAKDLGLQGQISEGGNAQYVDRILSYNVELSNVRDFAKRIRTLAEARHIIGIMSDTAQIISKSITGKESISQIISMAENPILDYTNKIAGNEDGVQQIAVGVDEYIDITLKKEKQNGRVSVGYPIWESAIGGLNPGVHLLTGRPKVFKAQPLDSIIYTKNDGPVLNQNLVIGELICNANSTYSKIVGIYPQGKKDIYQISFKDGDSFRCCIDHLFKIKSRRWSNYKILSLEDILKTSLKESDRYKWQVPLPEPACFESISTFISPYLMGLLLGDGSFRGNSLTFTTNDLDLLQDINNEIKEYGYFCKFKGFNPKKMGYTITKGRTGKQNIYIQKIKSFGLWNKKSNDKFIPECYLFNSIENRLSLLKGLMDTDGTVKKRNFNLSTTSKLMAEQIKWLVNSLGGIAKIRPVKTRYTKKDGTKSDWFDSFRVYMYINNNIVPFNLQRKIDETKKRHKSNVKRVIKSIVNIGPQDCQCIKLDSDDGLYLTDNFILTHNSTHAMNSALVCAGKNNIPTLLCDTEMSLDNGQWARAIAMISKVPFNKIFSGNLDDVEQKKVNTVARMLKKMPLHYVSVSGKEFEEIISMIRRWLIQTVKYNEHGKINNCLVIFDYLKLNSSSPLKQMTEWQELGFRVSALHELTVKYKFPVILYSQLNRENDIAASDRLRWYSSSICTMQRKSEEEIAEDGPEGGNRKLIIEDCRFGAGLDYGDYINYNLHGQINRLYELSTRNELLQQRESVV